jgi:hypothetical protein
VLSAFFSKGSATMAEQAEPGLYKRFDTAVTNAMSAVYDGVMRDGAVMAFLRQGANELAAAFGVMTPESIQVTEPGSVFHPLHSDIAASRESGLGGGQQESGLGAGRNAGQDTGHSAGQGVGQAAEATRLPSPSEIGRDAKANGSLHGEVERDSKTLPSPSEIGREQQSYRQPEQQRDRGQEQGREM